MNTLFYRKLNLPYYTDKAVKRFIFLIIILNPSPSFFRTKL